MRRPRRAPKVLSLVVVALVAVGVLLSVAPLARAANPGPVVGYTFEGQFTLSNGNEFTVLAPLTESATGSLTGTAVVAENNSTAVPTQSVGTFSVTGSVTADASGGPGSTFTFVLTNPGPVQLTALSAGTSFTFGLVNPGPINFGATLPSGATAAGLGFVKSGLFALTNPGPIQDTFEGQFSLSDGSQFTVLAFFGETDAGALAGHAVVVERDPGPIQKFGTFAVSGTNDPNPTGGPGTVFTFVLTTPGPIQHTALSAGTSFTFGLVNPGPQQFSGDLPSGQAFSGPGFVLRDPGPSQFVFAGQFSLSGVGQFTLLASLHVSKAYAITGTAHVVQQSGDPSVERGTFSVTGSETPSATGGAGGTFTFVLTNPGPTQRTALSTGTSFTYGLANPGPVSFVATLPSGISAPGTGFVSSVMIAPGPIQSTFEGAFSLPDGDTYTVLASLGESKAGGLVGQALAVETDPGPIQFTGTFSVTGLVTADALGGSTFTFVLVQPGPTQDTSLPVGTSFSYGMISPGPINFVATLPSGGTASGAGYVLVQPGPPQLVFAGQFSLADGSEFTAFVSFGMSGAGKLTGGAIVVENASEADALNGTFNATGSVGPNATGGSGFSFSFVFADPGPMQDTSLPVGTSFSFVMGDPGPIGFVATPPSGGALSGSGFVLVQPGPIN